MPDRAPTRRTITTYTADDTKEGMAPMSTTTQFLRNRFTDESISTASPARIVVMAYDRIDRDLVGALQALEFEDLASANALLCHAQDLVTELHGMLDLEAWEHAASLASIYRFVNDLLTTANVRKRSAEVLSARALMADLGSAFREAATMSATPPAATPPATTPSAATSATTTATSERSTRPETAPGRRLWIQA